MNEPVHNITNRDAVHKIDSFGQGTVSTHIYCNDFFSAKTHRIPPVLQTDATKKRKRKKEATPKKLVPIANFCTKACVYIFQIHLVDYI